MAPSSEATTAAKAGVVPEAEDQPVASSSRMAGEQTHAASPEVEQGAATSMRTSPVENSKEPEKEEMTAANFDPDKLSPEMYKVWRKIEDAIAAEERLKRERAAARARKRKRCS